MSDKDILESVVGILRDRERTIELKGEPKTPEEAGLTTVLYGGNRCQYCRWAHNRNPDVKDPFFLWCVALYNPNRIDNLANPKNQQVGIWVEKMQSCNVFRRR